MSYGGIIRKIIIILMIAIIVGAITATTATSPWKFAVLADINGANYANGFDVATNTLEFLVRDIKNQDVDLVIFPGDMIEDNNNIGDYKERLDSWKTMM